MKVWKHLEPPQETTATAWSTHMAMYHFKNSNFMTANPSSIQHMGCFCFPIIHCLQKDFLSDLPLLVITSTIFYCVTLSYPSQMTNMTMPQLYISIIMIKFSSATTFRMESLTYFSPTENSFVWKWQVFFMIWKIDNLMKSNILNVILKIYSRFICHFIMR